ncbi:E3 ubiquitin-protein ligase TRIM63a [Engraulis encrasicolus]|uniref:E3 ubiquitin-protein ligase TRIM63a n=1 Tax=Engraulis encrasicolus TaxID=184585 RepID=UPI002FD747FF
MEIQTSQMVRPPSPMESLEKQLSCPICLDMFTKPVVILPCQHNLCRSCANDLYDSQNPYHYSGGIFRCPTCRHEVCLDRHGVYGLQRNLLVENIIDIYKQQLENSSNGNGNNSSGDENEAPLKAKDAKTPMCQEHEEEHINIYCLTCQTPTCSMCKVFGQHKDCEVTMLETVYDGQKTELRNAVDLLAAGNSYLQASLTQMDDTCKTVGENAELQKRLLGEKFDLLYAIMEERKAELQDKIQQEQDEKVAMLRSLVEQYKQQLEASTRLMDTASQCMNNSSVAEFLVSAKQLITDAKDTAKKSLLERPEAGFVKMDHFTLYTDDVEVLLAQLDFDGIDEEEFEETKERLDEEEEEEEEEE